MWSVTPPLEQDGEILPHLSREIPNTDISEMLADPRSRRGMMPVRKHKYIKQRLGSQMWTLLLQK